MYKRSPLNYVGGKYTLLPQILPLFPSYIRYFVDLFTGGATVAINVKAGKVIANDIQKPVIDIYTTFQKMSKEDVFKHINNRIEEYGLSKTDKEAYLKFRDDYNKNPNPLDLFVLIVFCYNHQLRFAKNGMFNQSFGNNKSWFNPNIQKNLDIFLDSIKNITFCSTSYDNIDLSSLTSRDFIYCDPPYLITYPFYNVNDPWNKDKEVKLLEFLDNINEQGVKFALSNVLENKKKSNDILKEWCEKYNVHHLNRNYDYCQWSAVNKGSLTDEVLITNY